uniref:DNA2/NAM7 helicase-like C-terminal domain-containing protein n=1 Tax=Panagrolaimus superbus TaxID=310955 RepID=A0A914YF44_9BILA
MVGDVKQLDTFKGSLPEVCIPLGFGSALLHASRATGEGVAQVYLTKTFRFHPEIAKFLSELCYEGKLETTITEDQRPYMSQLSNRELPIVLANVLGKCEPAFPTSRTNKTHTKAAVWLANEAKKKLPECTIVILTFYNGQRDEIMEALGETSIEVTSIDAFQGKEADIIILVTTSTDKFAKTFIDDQQRLTVAFSRARSGMFVIGYAEALRQLPNWGKFIQKLKDKNNIVNLVDLR